jgi:hypothetical protein
MDRMTAPNTSILIFGPRGSGKSYQAHRLLQLYPYALLLDSDLIPFNRLSIFTADPLRTLRELEAVTADIDVIVCMSPMTDNPAAYFAQVVDAMQFGQQRNFIHMRMGNWPENSGLPEKYLKNLGMGGQA